MSNYFEPLPNYEKEYTFDRQNQILFSLARKTELKGTIRTCRGVTQSYYTLVKTGIKKQVSISYINSLFEQKEPSKQIMFNITNNRSKDLKKRSIYYNDIDLHNEQVKRLAPKQVLVTKGKTTSKTSTTKTTIPKIKLVGFKTIKKGA